MLPTTARLLAPAKLNLFLELVARRNDGYHDIDTVMVPIDWCDTLELQRTREKNIRLTLAWQPSRAILAKRLGVELDSLEEQKLLGIPDDERNLVHRALRRFQDEFNTDGGFHCMLAKRIPAGAGMGGASSDAAAAIRAAARLGDISPTDPKLWQIAAELGSDVPFFLGIPGAGQSIDGEYHPALVTANHVRIGSNDDARHDATANSGQLRAVRGTGRGEVIHRLDLRQQLALVVVFPGRMLSTPLVYGASKVPRAGKTAQKLIDALASGRQTDLHHHVFNRLSEPASAIEPQIQRTLDLMQQTALLGCQMTGSGSACFGFVASIRQARQIAVKLMSNREVGGFVRACQTIRVPPSVTVR